MLPMPHAAASYQNGCRCWLRGCGSQGLALKQGVPFPGKLPGNFWANTFPQIGPLVAIFQAGCPSPAWACSGATEPCPAWRLQRCRPEAQFGRQRLKAWPSARVTPHSAGRIKFTQHTKRTRVSEISHVLTLARRIQCDFWREPCLPLLSQGAPMWAQRRGKGIDSPTPSALMSHDASNGKREGSCI